MCHRMLIIGTRQELFDSIRWQKRKKKYRFPCHVGQQISADFPIFAFSGYLDFQHPADRDKQTSNSTRICSICPNELRLKPHTTEHLYFDQPDHNRPTGHFRPIYGVFHEKKKKKALKSRLDQVFRLWCADSTFQTALLMHAGFIIFLAVVSIAIIGWQKKK